MKPFKAIYKPTKYNREKQEYEVIKDRVCEVLIINIFFSDIDGFEAIFIDHNGKLGKGDIYDFENCQIDIWDK